MEPGPRTAAALERGSQEQGAVGPWTTVGSKGSRQGSRPGTPSAAPKVPAESGTPAGPRGPRRLVKAVSWTLGGQSFKHGLRLLSNIVMTQLLYPEVFGLMTLVWTVLTGLNLLSDVGVGPSIVQSERGVNRSFLNTAWTLQVARGVVLAVGALVLAYPMSWAYDAPRLAPLLGVAAVVPLISGFDSVGVYLEKRDINVGAVIRLELLAHVIGLGIMVSLALVWKSVWPLLVGGVANAACFTVGSHFMLRGHRHRFEVDRDSFRILFRFGKWIFLSTALTFLATHGDRLLLGQYLPMAALGIYYVAGRFSEALITVMNNITHNLLFPLLSETHRERPENLYETYRKSRLRTDALFVTAAGGLFSFGPTLIQVLYDPRYHQAGEYLQLLAIPAAMGSAFAATGSFLAALGDFRMKFMQSLGRALWLGVGMPLGFHLGGTGGLLVAVATQEVPVMAVNARALWRRNFLNLWVELRPVGFFGVGVGLGAAASSLLTPWLSP